MAKVESQFSRVCSAILKVVKQTLHAIEKLIIDVVFRELVYNYDLRHGKSITSNTKNNNKPTQKDDNTLIAQLEGKIKILETEKQYLTQQLAKANDDLEFTRKELMELAQTNELFVDSIADLKATIESLSKEKVKRISEHTIKENVATNKQQTTLFAEPDATGSILRKASSIETRYSLYKLQLDSRNEQICQFSLLNNDATSNYIASRELSLKACQITELGATLTQFVTIEPGTAIKENNNWVVTKPAKIKIV